MTPTRREILERVARGEITPEEADELLHEPTDDQPAVEPEPSQIKLVKISAGFGAIVIEGDPTVAAAEVEGPHSVVIEDDTFVVHAESGASSDEMLHMGPGMFRFNFNLGHKRGRHGRSHSVRQGRARQGGRQIQFPSLRVRMNPDLALDAKLDAGTLSIAGIHGPIRARAAAGPITIEDFAAQLDVSVNAGAIRAIGKLTEGDSRVRSDAGAVRIELDPSSSVRIIAESALGGVVLPDHEESSGRRFGSKKKATIGSGDATLRVDTAMGSISVSTLDRGESLRS